MAKDSINDYSTTPGSNTDIQSINIAEGMSPANVNNALREVMADLADVRAGNIALTGWKMAAATVTGTLTVDTVNATTLTATTFTQTNISASGNATIGGTLGVTGAITGSSTIDGTVITGTRFVATGSTAATNGMYLPGTNTIGFSTNSGERFRINASGALGIGGANYGTSGQVLTSGGSAAPPTWEDSSAYDPTATTTSPYAITFPVNGATANLTIRGGAATTGGSGYVDVTFAAAFTAAPRVTVSPIFTSGAEDSFFANASVVTTTGVRLWVYSDGGTAQSSKTVHWMAIGPTA
jgi:hypothetical protein